MRTIVETIAGLAGVSAPKRDLPKAAAYLFAVLSEAQAAVTRQRPLATRDGIAALQEARRVTSQRAIDELGATFRPFAETVADELEYLRTGILAGASTRPAPSR